MPDGQKIEDRMGTFGDEFYERLMATHNGLSEEESHALNARLVLLMANEIGDPERLGVVLKAAFNSGRD